MSAVEALRAAYAAGIKVQLDGNDLVLAAATPPPQAILDRLTRHKPLIISMLAKRDRPKFDFGSNRVVATRATERSNLIEAGVSCNKITVNCPAPPVVCDGSGQAFEEAYRTRINAALNGLPAPHTSEGHRLVAATRQFIGSNWFSVALERGWTLEELFGVDACAPLDQHEQWGLVVGLALAPRRRDTIERIDDECAVICYLDIATSNEKHRVDRRFSPSNDTVLWWDCTELVGVIDH